MILEFVYKLACRCNAKCECRASVPVESFEKVESGVNNVYDIVGAQSTVEAGDIRVHKHVRCRKLSASGGILLLLSASALICWSKNDTLTVKSPFHDLRGFERLEAIRLAGRAPTDSRWREGYGNPEALEKEIELRRLLNEEDAIYGDLIPGKDRAADDDVERNRIFYAKCGLSVHQAAVGIGLAGISIAESQRLCDGRFNDSVGECGANIANAVTQLAWSASYITYAPAFCQVKDIVASWCGGDSMWLLGAIGEIVTSGFGVSVDCRKGEFEGNVPRRLRPTREREAQIANCALRSNMAGDIIAKLGVNGVATKRSCKRMEYDDKGENRLECAGYITTMISYVPFLASQFAFISSYCPEGDNLAGLCVADTSDIVASVLSLGAFGSTIRADCNERHGPPEAPPDGF
eukprot:TRINITY_DN76796_c0_g1_i1.p1 TRINITY_DN76796_c0_g1~~TRINITY_DN76796_c0_g1_i1.p1  ORF type:complete len:407 (+),score=47.00 TRINITY_DN76796_c0_g1_i1:26-1246(+)